MLRRSYLGPLDDLIMESVGESRPAALDTGRSISGKACNFRGSGPHDTRNSLARMG